MDGDTDRLNARIDGLVSSTEDKLAYLRGLIRDLEDRLNQEESDRGHADTDLEDRMTNLEG